MSDLNGFSGEILIDPPLSWAEIRSGPSVEDVELRLVEVVVDTDRGRITTVTAPAIIPCEGRYDGRHAVRDIQAIVNAHGATHTFAGWIQMQPDLGYGESTPARYVVSDGRVETVVPRLVWPDDEPATAFYPGMPGARWCDSECDNWILDADGRMWLVTESEEPADPVELSERLGPMTRKGES